MTERYVFIKRNEGTYHEVEFNHDLSNYTLERRVEKLLSLGDESHMFYSERNANWFRNLHKTSKNERICL